MKINARRTCREMAYLIAGNLGYGIAYDCFFTPNGIAAGGFGGLGLVINQLIPVSIGVIVFVMSVPIFLWSFKVQGIRYTLSALISTAAFSICVDLLDFLPAVTSDGLLAAISGGVIYGISSSLHIMGGVSGSGTDLLARLMVTKFRSISLGTMLMVCDGVVVVLSAIVFGNLEAAVLATVSLFVLSAVTDAAIRGVNRANLFVIIAEENAERLAEEIIALGRGVTMVKATGMYAKRGKNMVLAVVRPRQVYPVKDIIKNTCPEAFVMLLPANEILGEGFRGLDVTVPIKENSENE